MEHILNTDGSRACLEDLCTTSTLRNDETLLSAAAKLDWGFYDAKVFWSYRYQVQYAIVWHRNFQLVLFPGSAHIGDWVSMRGNLNCSKKGHIAHRRRVRGARARRLLALCGRVLGVIGKRAGALPVPKVVFAGHRGAGHAR